MMATGGDAIKNERGDSRWVLDMALTTTLMKLSVI